MNRRTELILLVTILLLAAVMRMGWPGITEFKRDEALLSRLALDMVRGRDFPLHGIRSSVGLPNPPVSVYLFAIPYAISPNPIVATWFVGMLNVLAVALVWRLARRYLGAWPALLAALLYAASPWAVLYSRKIWAQNLLPPFVVVLVYTGLRGFLDAGPSTGLAPSKGQYQVAHLALLALTVQIHMAAVSLVPLTVVMLVVGRKRIDRRFWIGAALGVLTLVPFGIAALRGGWLERLGDFTGGEGRTLALSIKALQYGHLLAGGSEIHSLAGADMFQAFLDGVPPLWPLLSLAGVLGLVSAVWLVAGDHMMLPKNVKLILGLWVWLPILTFTLNWTPVYPHYLIAMLPGVYIAMAAGARALAAKWRQAAIALAGGALVLTISQVYLTLALLSFIDTRDVRGAFGAPLGDLLAIRDAAMLAGDGEIIVSSTGDNPAYDEPAVMFDFLFYEHGPGARFIDGRQTRLYPPAPAVFLTTPGVNGTVAATEALVYPHGTYRLLDWDGQTVETGGSLEYRLANGVVLRAFEVDAGGTVWLTWQPSAPADRQYSFFVHLLDAEGGRIAQADVTAWPGPWRAGDVIVTRFELGEDVTMAPGAVWRLGMYYFTEDGDTRGVDVLDEAGNPAGQWVSPGP